MTRVIRRHRTRIMNRIIIVLAIVVLEMVYLLIPGYPQTSWQHDTTEITILSVKESRNSLLEIKDRDGDLYYTHEVNKKYIEHNVDGRYYTFNVRAKKSSIIAVMLKIKPRYEISNWEVKY